MSRKAIPLPTKIEVLTQAGYRCSVPVCNHILTLHIHHIVQVAKGGGNEQKNLLVLCPNHHALYHQGQIAEQSLRVWKGLQVALYEGFGARARDDLFFLAMEKRPRYFSADATLSFRALIAAGLVLAPVVHAMHQFTEIHRLDLSPRGWALVEAWKKGDETAFKAAFDETFSNGAQRASTEAGPPSA